VSGKFKDILKGCFTKITKKIYLMKIKQTATEVVNERPVEMAPWAGQDTHIEVHTQRVHGQIDTFFMNKKNFK
jgi:hypothetical protein